MKQRKGKMQICFWRLLLMMFLCFTGKGFCEMPLFTVYETQLHCINREPCPAEIWYAEGDPYVPLVDLMLISDIYPEKGFCLEDGCLRCQTEEGFFLFDVQNNIICQHDFDVTAPLNEGGAPVLECLGVQTEHGQDVRFDLTPYGYTLYAMGNSYLVPVPVLSTILVEAFNDMLFSDGQSLYYATIHEVATEEQKALYDSQILTLLKKGPWKEPVLGRGMAKANFEAFCFRMDYAYGYRSRWPDGFEQYMQSNWPQVYSDMLSGDPYDIMRATNDIILYCVNDIHTSSGDMPPWFMRLSAKQKAQILPKDGNLGPSRVLDRESKFTEYTALRAKYLSGARPSRRYEGVRFYKDMAVISWDEFTMDMDWWSHYSVGDAVTVKDTLGFLYRSFEKIQRREEIKIVVFDLTCNYGGITDGGLLAMGFMKQSFYSTLQSGLTGAKRTEIYRADTNLDGIFDSLDSFEGRYSFYILISAASFSCGNLLPAMAKEQGAAVIIGERSAGGGCAIYIMKDLYGTTLGYSGTWGGVTQDYKGRTRSNDVGVEPDIYLDSSSFYVNAKLRNAIPE